MTRTYQLSQGVCSRLGGGFILAYHDLPAAIFENQIQALRPNEPVHLSELSRLHRAGRSTAGLFAITFDDGVGSTVRDISDVCKRRSWPVTFYLPTDYLNSGNGLPFQSWHKLLPYLPFTVLKLRSREVDLSTEGKRKLFIGHITDAMCTQSRTEYQPIIDELAQWLIDRGLATASQLMTPAPVSWAEVAELAKHDAIRFESHGATHTAVVALSASALRGELKISKRSITEHTNRECRHFCYPFGGNESIGRAAPSVVADEYETAVTMSRGRLRGHSSFLLPRIPIYSGDAADVARLKILTI